MGGGPGVFHPGSPGVGSTSTSGGGGGGGGIDDGDLYDIALKTVDLSDTSEWQLHDPDSLIASVAFVNGRNVITLNELASGSNAKYNWKNSGTKAKVPRWYKTAKIGTNNVNREDLVTGIYMLDFDSTREASVDIVVGLSKIPTSDVTTGVNLGGAFGQVLSTPGSWAGYGVYTFSGSTFLSTGNPERGVVSFQHGADRIGGGVAALLDSSNESNNSGIDRSSNQAHSDNGRPMSILVGLGLRQDNTPLDQGDQVKVAIKYLLIKADLS